MPGREYSGGAYKYGFNGKEKEADGTADNYDFGARIYDGRLGRFVSIDPFYRRYPMQSPYQFAVNVPIKLIEIFGMNPGDVVIAFGGGDIWGTGDKGIAPSIISKINAQHIYSAGGKSKSFASQYVGVSPDNKNQLDKATQEAYDFIKSNYNISNGENVTGGKVIIEGYSMGGVLANHLSERLRADNISVDLLVTIDAAAGPKTDKVDRTISSNVKKNINIYQTTESSVGSRGAPNIADDISKTQVVNNNYTGYCAGEDNTKVEHSTIDDITESRVVKDIVDALGGEVAPKYTPPPDHSDPKDNTRTKPVPIIKH